MKSFFYSDSFAARNDPDPELSAIPVGVPDHLSQRRSPNKKNFSYGVTVKGELSGRGGPVRSGWFEKCRGGSDTSVPWLFLLLGEG